MLDNAREGVYVSVQDSLSYLEAAVPGNHDPPGRSTLRNTFNILAPESGFPLIESLDGGDYGRAGPGGAAQRP